MVKKNNIQLESQEDEDAMRTFEKLEAEYKQTGNPSVLIHFLHAQGVPHEKIYKKYGVTPQSVGVNNPNVRVNQSARLEKAVMAVPNIDQKFKDNYNKLEQWPWFRQRLTQALDQSNTPEADIALDMLKINHGVGHVDFIRKQNFSPKGVNNPEMWQ